MTLEHYVDEGEMEAQHAQFFSSEMLLGIRSDRVLGPPAMVDCGANIGTASSWFLHHFPDANVVAIEPDPVICGVLRMNVARYGGAVEVVEAAAWSTTGQVPFVADHVQSSRIANLNPHDRDYGDSLVEVGAVDLRGYLGRPVTLLKLDVEGAELVLLDHCRAEIAANVSYIHVEVHEFLGRSRILPECLEIIQGAGFEFHVAPLHVDPQPFLRRQTYRGIVNPVAVYGWKPTCRPEATEVAVR